MHTLPDAPLRADRPTRRLGTTLIVGLVAAAAALVFFGWLATEMLRGDTRLFDERVRALVHQAAAPWMTTFFRTLTTIGAPVYLSAAALALVVLFIRRRWWRGSLLLVVTLAGAGLLDTVLKLSFRRPRPAPLFDYPLPSSYSFPSGHALYAFCFFGAVAALVTPRLDTPLLRAVIWAIALTLVTLIGLSRIYLGVHHPSDVLAGYAAGLIWVVVVALGDRVAHRIADRRRRR